MTSSEFDERLRHTFDQLSARLREEIARQLNAVVAELSTSVEADRTQAVNEATREAWTVAEREVSERLTASLAAAEARARVDLETDEISASERLLGAIRSLDRGQSLSEILNALVESAAAATRRAAIFLLEGTKLRGWRFVGFDPALEKGELELSDDTGGVIAEAAATATVARAGDQAWSSSSLSLAPAFAELQTDRPALAVPLVMSGQVFGVLYADHGLTDDVARASWPATVEVLARHAARSLEAVTAVRLAEYAGGTSGLRA